MLWKIRLILAVSGLLIVANLTIATPKDPGSNISSAAICEDRKLRAAGEYVECVLRPQRQKVERNRGRRVDPLAGCDQQFDRAFELAEKAGACRTAGGPASLRGPLKAQAERTEKVIATGAGCQKIGIVDSGKLAVCTLDTSTSAIDLAAVIAQIQGQGATVNDNTVFWIEAWGGTGGTGSGGNGSPGGAGGYAQTTATLAGYGGFYGTSELFYYLGINGTNGPGTGGDGGTATVISPTAFNGDPLSAPLTVLIAPGGGGGGAGQGPPSETTCSVAGALGRKGRCCHCRLARSEVRGGFGGRGARRHIP